MSRFGRNQWPSRHFVVSSRALLVDSGRRPHRRHVRHGHQLADHERGDEDDGVRGEQGQPCGTADSVAWIIPLPYLVLVTSTPSAPACYLCDVQALGEDLTYIRT
jgi:hypothetical protein